MNQREMYFNVCIANNTNLSEIFNYLCEFYHQTTDKHRFELLQNIYNKKYNLNEILIGYKQHNNNLEKITFSISLSLLFIIKYIKAYHTSDPENDISIQILENQVRAKKIGEEKLLPIIIYYFATSQLSYK